MLSVHGKIESARTSRSGKSTSVQIGGTWVNVANDDLSAFKDVVGKGQPIPISVRTQLNVDADGNIVTRKFKKRDGSDGSGPDIQTRFWFRKEAAANNALADLLGKDVAAGETDPE